MAVPTLEAELVVEMKAGLGEGSIWDSRSKKLLWLDIVGAKIFRFDPVSKSNEEFDLSSFSPFVSSVVPISQDLDPHGDVVGVTLRDGFATYNFRSRSLQRLGNDPGVQEGERFNDGKVDPRGCYWAGTIARNSAGEILAGASALYCREADGAVQVRKPKVSISNGIVWTKDSKVMYYIDTPSARVEAWDFDLSTGAISNPRPAVSGFDFATTGFPDGCAIDTADRLWVARFNGGCCGWYDPRSGELLAEVRVPAAAGKQVTSVAFGGENLEDLYLTTAREGFDPAAAERCPLAGSLFVVPKAQLAEIGAVPGQPANQLKLAP
ncbi:unnamed protein product [Effrenium voratum]|uniref:SMP-30/Gluconolactonase/LRE-like region domain-containing protein n=1 Tax=Effrenium voratum TaxID=2562239 RepID=A0AA36HY81_9DINO|nr:unnamed protein product [Effrenium voratum]